MGEFIVTLIVRICECALLLLGAVKLLELIKGYPVLLSNGELFLMALPVAVAISWTAHVIVRGRR